MNPISKSKIALYSRLASAKVRREHHLFIAEGSKCVGELLGKFSLEALVATQDWFEKHRLIIAPYEDKCLLATQVDLKKISSLATPPEVAAIFRIPEAKKYSSPLPQKMYLVIDGVQDPGNLGTIVRIADWFGIPAIFASDTSVDVFNPKCVQATMGALGRVDISYCDLTRLLSDNSHIPSYGTLLDGLNIYESELSPSAFIVMGSEGAGISPSLRQVIDHRILIPSYAAGDEHVESLNVAIATAITVAEFRRRN